MSSFHFLCHFEKGNQVERANDRNEMEGNQIEKGSWFWTWTQVTWSVTLWYIKVLPTRLWLRLYLISTLNWHSYNSPCVTTNTKTSSVKYFLRKNWPKMTVFKLFVLHGLRYQINISSVEMKQVIHNLSLDWLQSFEHLAFLCCLGLNRA